MAIVYAVSGWDLDLWMGAMRKMAPQRDLLSLDEAMTRPGDVEYALAWKAPAGALKAFANLKLIVSLGAGVDHLLDDPDLPDVPIVRVNDADMTGRMSEYVVLHVLMHHRQQRLYDAFQRARQWRPQAQWAAGAVGVGVMGLGVLGRDAAQKLVMMGFNVHGWSRTPRDVAGVTCHAGTAGLDDFLAASDILVVLLPLTGETAGIIDRDLIGRLKKDGPLGGPVLINAGRGGLHNEADILACLDAGELVAATLDVFAEEPLPRDSALWSHPAVTVTPHIAADSDPDTITAYALARIEDFEAGRDLINLVDRKRGY